MVSRCPVCGTAPPANAVVCPTDGTEVVSAEADPLVGTTVGTWRVLRRLGIGGMGAVYEAVETTIEKRVALKIVHPHFSEHPQLPSLIAEARAVNNIGDRGVVDIFGFGRLPDGRQYLVMELLEGESVDKVIARQKQLTWPELMAIAEPLLGSLQAAHAAGFVHRDIKASNVFIVRPPRGAPFPKLLDFGLAQRAMTHNTQGLGTPDYVAPEQAAGQQVGPTADLYAFGCLLFEMTTGRVPFVGEGAVDVLEQHRSGPRPHAKALRPDAPVALDELIVALMQIEPADRPSSAADVLKALRLALPMPRPGARLRRATLGLALAVTAGAVWFVLDGRPQPRPLPPPDPMAEAVATAARHIAEQLDAGALAVGGGAVEQLLAAEASFPARGELSALHADTVRELQLAIAAAMGRDDLDGAERLMSARTRLEPRADGGSDEQASQLARARFARLNGMVRVGPVFIDAFEYPNRKGSQPSRLVDWKEASALCNSAGKHLCSEAEWQTACVGAGHRAFPYGDSFERLRCRGKQPRVTAAAPSGSFSGCVTSEGVYDLSGNLAEWTSTPLRDGAPQRVIRGGSFKQSDPQLSCEARDYYLPGLGGAKHIGFRCCY